MKKRPNILIVDDDIRVIESVALGLSGHYRVFARHSVDAGIESVKKENIDVAVIDLNFNCQKKDGLDFIAFMTLNHPEVPLIVYSGDANTKRVLKASSKNIVAFVVKESGIESLMSDIERGLRKKEELSQEEEALSSLPPSKEVRTIVRNVKRISQELPESIILISGEVGTGKGSVVKNVGALLKKEVLRLNLSANPEKVDRLFSKNKDVLIFLDEVERWSPEIQEEVLIAIRDNNVGFIASSNDDLSNLVDQGKFCFELAERMNCFHFQLPPLRERAHDIEFYFNSFVDELRGKKGVSITRSAIKLLKSQKLPLNILTIKNVATRLFFRKEKVIDAEAICSVLGPKSKSEMNAKSKNVVNKEAIIKAMRDSHGNKTHASKKLGITPPTLRKLIRELNIAKNFIHFSKIPRKRSALSLSGGIIQ